MTILKFIWFYVLHSQEADALLTGIATSTGGYSFFFSGSQVSTGMQDALLATFERRRNKDTPITVSVLNELYKLTICNPLCRSRFGLYESNRSPVTGTIVPRRVSSFCVILEGWASRIHRFEFGENGRYGCL